MCLPIRFIERLRERKACETKIIVWIKSRKEEDDKFIALKQWSSICVKISNDEPCGQREYKIYFFLANYILSSI